MKKRLLWPFREAAIWQGLGDDVIALHGRDGRFIKVSQGASTIFGMSPDDLVGKRLMDIVTSESQSSLLSALARIGNKKGSGRARFDCRLRDGHKPRARVEIALARLPDGRMRSITRPIEHRLAREQAVREKSEQAISAAVRRNDHLANVSHEIRTPLNAVIGFADALHAERFGPIENDRYKDYARAIHDSGAHLQSLISDLLDLSKVEADEMSIRKTAASPAEIVDLCANIMRLQATEAGLYIRTEIDPNIGECMLDPKLVRQILLNIVSNALKFTKHGGVTISLRRDGAMLSLTVVDTGIGMSPDDLAMVGARFKQARSEGVRGARGTGIGLALSKALARVHGGELRLMSAVGEGTTAMLRIPFETVPQQDETPTEEKVSRQNLSNVTRLSDVKRG